MFAKKDKVYKKNSLSKFVLLALELLNDDFVGIDKTAIIDILNSKTLTEHENNIVKKLREEDTSDEDIDSIVIDDYSLLIIQKIRFANIMEKFYSKKTSKNSNISDCYVNTYDIEYVNKYLSKTNGRIKKLKSSTIDKIKELEDDK